MKVSALRLTQYLLQGMLLAALALGQKVNPSKLPKLKGPYLPRNYKPHYGAAKGGGGVRPLVIPNPGTWAPIGPSPLSVPVFGGGGGGIGNVSGRMTGIAVDPTNDNTIYIAAAGGGVWKSTDGGVTYAALTDNQTTLAMGAIAVAPSNHLKIYAGTGEANNSLDSNYGGGILVSGDGGATWALSTGPGGVFSSNHLTTSKISVNPINANIAYAAIADTGFNGLCLTGISCTNTGIYETTDGGVTWTNVTAALGLDSSLPWSDVVVDPNTPNIVYAAHGDIFTADAANGIYRSMDSGATWTALTANGAPNGSTTGRYALAVAPSANTSGSHVLYAAVANPANGGLFGLFISSNADVSSPATPTFTKLTNTPDFLGGGNVPLTGGGQGWYDIAIGVDPHNAAVVYGAGQVFYGAEAGGAGCGATHVDCDHVVVSKDSGVTWTDLTIVGGVEPHTDSHAIAFTSTSNMLLGNDGGIWSYNPSGAGSWTNLNGNLSTIQFTQISLHPSNGGIVLGGSQDNGTEAYSNSTTWNQVDSGDGGFTAISRTMTTRMYHTYAGGGFVRSDDSGATWVDKSTGISTFNGANFYPPFLVDPGNGNHVLYGTDILNETTAAGDSWTAIGFPGAGNFNGNVAPIDSIALGGGGGNPFYIYVAVGGDTSQVSQIFLTTNDGGTWAERDVGINGHVKEIDVDPNDVTGNTAFVVINNFTGTGQVFRTINGGLSWTNVSGNLPAIPAWSLKVDTDADHTVYVSTETAGVFSSSSPFTVWTQFGSGLPNAEGKDLEINRNLRILAVGTHGRSAWQIGLVSVTAVKVTSFNATRNVDGRVLLAWQTGFGADDLGYRLYREENGLRVLVTPATIAGGALQAPPGVKLLAGRSYAWTDTSLPPGVPANYWLEVVLVRGGSDWYGPAGVQDARSRLAIPANSALLTQMGQSTKIPTAAAQRSALLAGSAPAADAAALRPVNSVTGATLQREAQLAAGSAVKISVKQEGWYRVTQPQLVGAGLDPAVDPRTLQLFVDGSEIPISVRGEEDGTFDPSDSVEFYGIGLDTAASNSRTYWLAGGRSAGQRIRKSGGARAGTASSGLLLYSVEARPRSIYFSSLRNGDKENFFGPVVATDAVDQALTLHNIAANASGGATLQVTLQGVSAGAHAVKILVNGSDFGVLPFQAQDEGVANLNIPQSLLVEGDNTVRMAALTDGDISLVDTIRLSYWRRPSVDNDSLRFDVGGGQSLTLDAFSSENIRVLDVTNPDRAEELAGAIGPTANGHAISLEVPNRGTRTLFAFVDGNVQQPSAVWANRPSAWRQAGAGADMLIVAHKTLMGNFDSLLQLRQAQGYKIAVVDVEDIFDEFSFGDKSPQAMRDFLSFAKTNWQRAPRVALLVGHASYDPKNYLGAGDSDLVPTRILDTATMETASDDWFSAFNNDGLAQIQMGRLPARTPAEAALMVSKIIEHEAATQPAGVTLVADQKEDFDFGAASEALKPLLPANLPVDDIRQDQVDPATAKNLLNAALKAGRQMVNYAGHGSVDLWRNDVLTDADAMALTNWSNLPLFIVMSCLNGYFQDPILDSLAESLLKAPNGGASVVWAPSGMTDAGQQEVMNRALFSGVFMDSSTHTLGDAIQKAKASEPDTDIRLTWILFGDPLMKKQPQDRLYDTSGKPIVFYHKVGCWGNPPVNYLQILAAQQAEINQLMQTNTVIVIPCRSTGVL